MQYDLNSIDDLVRELGGNTVIANWLDIHPEAVSNWKRRGAIAPGWHLRIAAAIRRQGKSINPEIFGLSPEDTAGLLDA